MAEELRNIAVSIVAHQTVRVLAALDGATMGYEVELLAARELDARGISIPEQADDQPAERE